MSGGSCGATTAISPASRHALTSAAERLCRYPFQVWHYGDSIGFEGLLAATQLLDDPRFASFAYGVAKGWAGRSIPFRELDNTAPGHAMCRIYERSEDADLLAHLEQLADFLTQRPTLHGCFTTFARAPLREPHAGTLSARDQELLRDPGPGVFLDCLHFDPPYLADLGRMTARPALTDTAFAQAVAMIDLLQDQQSGLFHHFHLQKTDSRHILGWSRGQGWALLGLLDLLDICESHDLRPRVVAALTSLADAVVNSQIDNGHWPALIEKSPADTETSAALFFTAGLCRGVRLGILPANYLQTAESAWHAATRMLSRDGQLQGVTEAVWASTVEDHYRAVPTGIQAPWGQGALLVAAHERALLGGTGA